jgi:hypothetical protein
VLLVVAGLCPTDVQLLLAVRLRFVVIGAAVPRQYGYGALRITLVLYRIGCPKHQSRIAATLGDVSPVASAYLCLCTWVREKWESLVVSYALS